MQVFYANVWSDWGCAGAGYAIAASALAIFALLLGGLWLVFVRSGRAGATVLKAILLGSGVIMIITLGATLLTGSVLHRGALSGGLVLLDYCDGLQARRETLRRRDIAAVEYRLVRGFRTSDPPKDRLALRLAAGGERLVPLEPDPEVSPPAALAQLLTPEALAEWRAALAQRGRALPDAYHAARQSNFQLR